MSDLFASVQSESKPVEHSIDDEAEEKSNIETTYIQDIQKFNNWARSQASKDLSKFKNLTNVCRKQRT